MFKLYEREINRDVEVVARNLSLDDRKSNGLWFVMDYLNTTRNSIIVAPHDVQRHRGMGYEIRCAYCNGKRFTNYDFFWE